MKRFAVLSICILASCSSGGSVVTMNSFYDVPVGASQEEVVAMVGEPVSKKNLPDGSCEYEYVERFSAGGRTLNERFYIIVIKDGKVISKKIKQESPNPYGFDSYEMQTTQNQDVNF